MAVINGLKSGAQQHVPLQTNKDLLSLVEEVAKELTTSYKPLEQNEFLRYLRDKIRDDRERLINKSQENTEILRESLKHI